MQKNYPNNNFSSDEFTTIYNLETDIVSGPEFGSDYMTKPFSIAVIRAKPNEKLQGKTNNLKMNNESFASPHQKGNRCFTVLIFETLFRIFYPITSQ